MASSVLTLTKEKHSDQSVAYRLKSKEEKNEINEVVLNDYYDEALPKNDPKFLAPLRRWEKRVGFVTPIRWNMFFTITIFHLVATFYPLYLIYNEGLYPLWQSLVFGSFLGWYAGFGVTGGVHRYWTHRSYKAKLPLRIILIIGYSLAGQNSIPNWVRDHRVHHKLSETSADPHNAHRGFFFSHVGWLMMKKHPDVLREGSKIDMSDIHNDPMVKFHTKYFIPIKFLTCFIIPSLIMSLVWGESWKTSIGGTLFRYMLSLHFTWSVNSFAHIWGNKPYDPNITPVENWKVSIVAMGEGWHNYHHTFPWDYKAAELPYHINVTTMLIDLAAALGWAYDMKKASPSLIKAVIRSRGPHTEPGY